MFNKIEYINNVIRKEMTNEEYKQFIEYHESIKGLTITNQSCEDGRTLTTYLSLNAIGDLGHIEITR